MARISVCMMVKNGGDLFAQALRSVRWLADEIIVVNTDERAETDDTTVALAHGATVYHHPWQRNFSLHRNQTLEYASGDWVFVFDADEAAFLHEASSVEQFKAWLDELPEDIHGCMIQMRDVHAGKAEMVCNSARLFRRGCVTYAGRVHNQPQFKQPAALCEHLSIEHYGYDPGNIGQEAYEAKFKRQRDLLLEQIGTEEGRHAEFYLMQLYGSRGRTEESAEWGEKYMSRADELGEAMNPSGYHSLAKLLFSLEQWERGLAVLELGLSRLPDDPDLGACLSDYGAVRKDFDAMCRGAEIHIAGHEHYTKAPEDAGGRFFFSLRPDALAVSHHRLAMAHLEQGRHHLEATVHMLPQAHPNLAGELRTNLERLGMDNLIQGVFTANHGMRGEVKVGQGAAIKPTARIDCTGDVSIGEYFIMGEGARIFTHEHPLDQGASIVEQTQAQGVTASGLRIGNDVWIADGAMVLPQVTNIPTGCIIGAGAVLTKNPQRPYEIWVGNPARCIGRRPKAQPKLRAV